MSLSGIFVNTLPIVANVVMGFLLLLYLARYFLYPEALKPAQGPLFAFLIGESGRTAQQQPDPDALSPARLIGLVAVTFLLSRALIYLLALVMSQANGSTYYFLHDPESVWVRWDARHYIGLAENWYVNEGDPRFHIVFYPLYPLLVRVLRPLFFGHTALAACALSNACLLVSGWALGRLTCLSQGARAARRALCYLMFCPLSLFLSLPFSESLFLMLTLLSVLCARNRRMGLALCLGALCSATRMLGLVCAVPIYLEWLCIARERSGGDRKKYISRAAAYALLTFTVALGFLSYLLLNKAVTGDAFKFLQYQSEHWSQRFGSLANSLSYTLRNALTYDDLGTRLGTWIPQSVLMISVLALMAVTARRLHPGDGAYALIYFYVALSPTWLLSGSRYLMAMYPVYPMLALITRKRYQHALVMVILLLSNVYFTYMYAIYGSLF